MTLMEWLTSNKGELLLSGFAGSAVSVAMEFNGWRSSIRRLFIGGVTAYYLGPITIPLLQWAIGSLPIPVDAANIATLGGFVCGLCGIIINEIILKALRIRSAELKGHDDVNHKTD